MSNYDCLVVGGGPAGLTAAIYISRFHLGVKVIDAGSSRAGLIPCTRNHAGFPEGIAGEALLDRMRDQARRYGAEIEVGRVDRLHRDGAGFHAEGQGVDARATMVLLATGVTNRAPEGMDGDLHARALHSGQIRYCPVCDGYEVTDQAVCVIGDGPRGAREALFLRTYTADVTLISTGAEHDLPKEQRDMLAQAGVRLAKGPARDFVVEGDRITVECGGARLAFRSIYPALGSDIHSRLASDLGADTTTDGCIKVDPHQRTSVAGLYAAGDVVKGLDQISHAMGEAGVAATAIRNDLAERGPLLR